MVAPSDAHDERREDDPLKFDRPRGILTEADRRYLCGVSDIEPKSHGERRARARIRERVKHGMLDFEILLRHLDERDRDRIGYDVDGGGGAFRAPHRASSFIIGFLYFFAKGDHTWLESDVESGVVKGMARNGWMGEAECSIEPRRTERIDEIPEERIQSNLRDVSREQLRDMLLLGLITDEQFSDEIQRRGGDG